jgi:hypothetical protein
MINKALGVALSVAFLGVPAVSSQTIFGAAYNGQGAPATLYRISPVNGAATFIGSIGAATVSGMAFGLDGVSLYGVGLTGAGFALLRINTSTGAGTAIGLTTLSAPCQDIAFRFDGRLFCYSLGEIYTLSTTTGAATLVGSTGNFLDGNALAFSSGNILYSANQVELDSINQSTGAVTLVVPLNYSPAFGVGESRASAMKFHLNGTLYASVITGFPPAASASLGIINISTGAVTRVGPTTFGMDALAISAQTITPSPVPVPSSWLLVAIGLALVVLYKTRKRRPQS